MVVFPTPPLVFATVIIISYFFQLNIII